VPIILKNLHSLLSKLVTKVDYSKQQHMDNYFKRHLFRVDMQAESLV